MEESKYQGLIIERYDRGDAMSYEESCDLDFVYYGPTQYGNEDKMLEYVVNNPAASLKEVFLYWDSITPDGLPPGMTEEDLLDDEDD